MSLTFRRKPFRVNVFASSSDSMAGGPANCERKGMAGVFDETTDTRVEQFTESVSFDRRLDTQDIEGSIAHARMLAQVGLVTPEECRQIEHGLGEIRREIEQGTFLFHVEQEDIHMEKHSWQIDWPDKPEARPALWGDPC